MKENVLDVLMYLFETYVDTEDEPEADHSELRDELALAGFGDPEIDRALDWLDAPVRRYCAPEVPNFPYAATLEEQAKGPLLASFEMASTPVIVQKVLASDRGYREGFKELGVLSPTIDDAVSAIAAFERTLLTPAPF